METSNHRPLINITTRVLQSMHNYLRDNKLEVTEKELLKIEAKDSGVNYIEARADNRFKDDPGGIILTYDTPQCSLTLPAGRRLRCNYIAGYIVDISITLPLAPMSWDEMQVMHKHIIHELDVGGWQRAGNGTPKAVKENLTYQDFLKNIGPKWADVGSWQACNTPWLEAYVEVRHQNSSPASSFIPPAILNGPVPENAPDRFVTRVWFHPVTRAMKKELKQLRDARRIVVNGSANKALPLSVWLDDPDWRPDNWRGHYLK